jgi:putative cell wall-binding protein
LEVVVRHWLVAVLVGAASVVVAPHTDAAADTWTSPGVDSYVLGGEAVVSDAVADAVDGLLGGWQSRIAGSDRYTTAVRISSHFFHSASKVYVATGENFPDSLAGGPLAARSVSPVLLVASGWVPSSVVAEIRRLGASEIVILGGPGAVSDGVKSALMARTGLPVSRIAGADRYATASAISESWSPGVSVVFLATGNNYPDALSGGAAAAAADAPILLVQRDRLPAATGRALARLKPTSIVLLGGSGVISEEVASTSAKYATSGVVERWAGTDRYATAAAITRHAFPSDVSEVFIATGEDFPDALAGVVAAGVRGAPILLVQQNKVPSATKTELLRIAGPRLALSWVADLPGTDALAFNDIGLATQSWPCDNRLYARSAGWVDLAPPGGLAGCGSWLGGFAADERTLAAGTAPAALYTHTWSGGTWVSNKVTAVPPGNGPVLAIDDGRMLLRGGDGPDAEIVVATSTPGGWVSQRLKVGDGVRYWETSAADISGDVIAVADTGINSDLEGTVLVFTWDGSAWTRTAELRSEWATDMFGAFLDLDGDQLLVAADGSSPGAGGPGGLYLYTLTSSGWVPEVVAEGGEGFGSYGRIDGDLIVTGAAHSNENTTFWVMQRTSGGWRGTPVDMGPDVYQLGGADVSAPFVAASDTFASTTRIARVEGGA